MSPLKRYVNNFVLRFAENGLYDIHLEWARRLFRAVFQVNKFRAASTDARDPIVVDLNLMFAIFAFYLIGIAVSIVVFVIELKI